MHQMSVDGDLQVDAPAFHASLKPDVPFGNTPVDGVQVYRLRIGDLADVDSVGLRSHDHLPRGNGLPPAESSPMPPSRFGVLSTDPAGAVTGGKLIGPSVGRYAAQPCAGSLMPHTHGTHWLGFPPLGGRSVPGAIGSQQQMQITTAPHVLHEPQRPIPLPASCWRIRPAQIGLVPKFP